ncbi:hypothetical protein [Pontibacter virosus]|uniref:Uncharacterized protein n=1 Tax=Pontibacter virosus TaxID=1765052 RepID=A0A2U1ANF7_9BACT|nr:hypothetical protein [Pontibacter virosus]PVY37963.1 hypothetical protein C8E01_12065 [Pontibacter virosus]
MINQEHLRSPITTRKKVLITIGVTFFILSMLLLDHFHGGVPSHHILQSENYPAISNWWSGLSLPILTWFLLTRVKRRVDRQQVQQLNNSIKGAIQLFITGLVLGILIAISFEYGYSPFLDNVLYIILLLSLFIPIYYAEFILGFVIGMTYTFGAILPTAFILVVAIIGMTLYRFIRPLLLKLVKMMTNKLYKRPSN